MSKLTFLSKRTYDYRSKLPVIICPNVPMAILYMSKPTYEFLSKRTYDYRSKLPVIICLNVPMEANGPLTTRTKLPVIILSKRTYGS